MLSFPKTNGDSDDIIKGLLKSCYIYGITEEIKEITVELRKNSNLKLPDSIIAASAFVNKLPLITADKQFKKIDELEVIFYEV